MDEILVLDCGAQYAHLIARSVREQGVYSEIAPADIDKLPDNVKGVIISGGPDSVYNKGSPAPKLFNVPTMGVCYGHHYIAHVKGGSVKESGKKEYGHSKARILGGPLMNGLEENEDVWMSHGDLVLSLPDGFEVYAITENCPIAAYGNSEKGLYGVQFHPEVMHTRNGDIILRNFIYDICGCKPEWSMEDYASRAINEIKGCVGRSKAILGLSGGVDSATAAVLASKAIGSNLIAVYVDTGLMREGETEHIKQTFSNYPDLTFDVIGASDIFISKLRGIADPEKKRNIIGDLFASLFTDSIASFGADYLIQGTIYPDWVESAKTGKNASRIKTHHNVGSPEIERMRDQDRVIEPLRELYKDEVRKLAGQLGLPPEIIYRQPFPGPGLAVRIEGPVTKEKLKVVRTADKIVTDEIERAYTLEKRPWQYFAILTKSKRIGVVGDKRIYGGVITLRAVESREAMTAGVFHLDHDVQERIASRITNELPGITGVTYEITTKPPATIEWE